MSETRPTKATTTQSMIPEDRPAATLPPPLPPPAHDIVPPLGYSNSDVDLPDPYSIPNRHSPPPSLIAQASRQVLYHSNFESSLNSHLSSTPATSNRPGSAPAASPSYFFHPPLSSGKAISGGASMAGAAGLLLRRQLKLMQSEKDLPGISCGLVGDNIFEWDVSLMIDEDCDFYGGGIFNARLRFPTEYPLLPPKMRFETKIFHPNVYPSGEVCISILHPPEEDKYGYESASERWSPVQTPGTILLSVISMLSSRPNDESAANLEAAKIWRDDPKEFKKKCRRCVRDSLEG